MLKSLQNSFRSELRPLAPFLVFVLGHAALVLSIATWKGLFSLAAYKHYVVQFAPLYFVLLPVVLICLRLAIRIFRRSGRRNGPGALAQRLGRVAAGGVTLAMFIVFMGSFTTFKIIMPVLMGGFPHDRVQADFDAMLHGGVDPGPALLTWLGHPAVLLGLQWNYVVVWMAMTFVPVFFVSVAGEARAIRARYLLSFACCWAVLGNLLACLFLSAGPVFYAEVTGDAARFGDQLLVLRDHLGWAFQTYLWQNYAAGTTALGTGISAFPSLHVAAAMMNALFLRDLNRMLGYIGLGYVVLTAISSVLLGWHYAIDGYVSILVVLALHIGLKRLFGSRPPGLFTASPIPATA